MDNAQAGFGQEVVPFALKKGKHELPKTQVNMLLTNDRSRALKTRGSVPESIPREKS